MRPLAAARQVLQLVALQLDRLDPRVKPAIFF
jgi:hypothetical protein